MKVGLEKQTREKVNTELDTNRLGAGAFILQPDGTLEKDLTDEAMKGREQENEKKIDKE